MVIVAYMGRRNMAAFISVLVPFCILLSESILYFYKEYKNFSKENLLIGNKVEERSWRTHPKIFFFVGNLEHTEK